MNQQNCFHIKCKEITAAHIIYLFIKCKATILLPMIDIASSMQLSIFKHLICQPSNISLYQLERFAMSKSLLTSCGSAGLTYIWKNFISQKAIQIGKNIVNYLGPVWIGGIGLASAIAIGGLLYTYDNKITQTNETILARTLANYKISQVKAYLKAYESCFNNIHKIESYCKQIQSPSYLIKLQTHLNQILEIIKTPMEIKLDKQLQVCGLFYKIAKILIHLNCLINFNGLDKELQKLKKMHKQIKKVMNIRIQKRISINENRQVYFQNQNREKMFISMDKTSILSLDQLSTEVFDVIFRCPITKLQIQQLFKHSAWIEKDNSSADIIIQKSQRQRQELFLGNKYSEYNKIIQNQEARIRFINFDQKVKQWAGYYEQLKNKSGFHYPDFKTGGQIEFDKIKLLFISHCLKGLASIKAVTNSHKIIEIHQNMNRPQLKITQNLHFCIEFNQFTHIKSIKSKGYFNLKFELQPKIAIKQYGPFTGFIATLDKTYNIGFGVRGWLNWTKGYTFHRKNQTDKSQKLIFEAISEITFFKKQQQSDELSQFYCRITNEGDQTMHMMRDDRDKKYGVFGNNTTGGEIIRIKLIQKLGKGQYKGNLFIITPQDQSCIAYISSQKELEWTKNDKKDESTLFYTILNKNDLCVWNYQLTSLYGILHRISEY